MDTQTETLKSPPPIFAEPIVEVEVILPVLVGDAQFSLDTAIDRLGVIQDESRVLEKEKKALRAATESTLRANDIETHSTAAGRSATCYERTTDQYPDRKYLESILTPEQMKLAFPSKTSESLRIR